MYILTIAIPTFNMEWCLEKNLSTYDDPCLCGKLEVLCLNNASEDASLNIISAYVKKSPDIFRLVDRDSRGYGSSINDALAVAQGKYFRIVDADDWVDTENLIRQICALESCEADVVLTDYSIVNLQNQSLTPVRAREKGVAYRKVYTSFEHLMKTLPSIHATTYRTELLRHSGFQMQDKMFFVDEEYVILPYLYIKNYLYLDLDIYRYAVANPAQSTSPKNRAKYREHREKVLRRLLNEYRRAEQENPANPALPYCRMRITKGLGDHFTTLLMYVEDRKAGRREANVWKRFLRETAPEMWSAIRKKVMLLFIFSYMNLSLSTYSYMKKLLHK